MRITTATLLAATLLAATSVARPARSHATAPTDGASIVECDGDGDDDDDDDADPKKLAAAKKKMEAKKRALFALGRYDETGFKRMGKPRKGEWLDRFAERGQTFEEYKQGCKNKRSAARETMYIRPLAPLGPRAKAAIDSVRAYCEAFFQLKTKVLDAREIPAKAFVKERDQYDEAPIMDALRGERPDDALVYCALADKDLFSEGLNYVFGVGSLEDRVGVYSLVRFGQDDDGKKEAFYRRRAFQLVSHELGHILSIEHCIFYECVMNGSNSLEESDAAPCDLCPVCREKLQWNVGFDHVKRYRDLAKLYRDESLPDEAKWVEAQAARLDSTRAKPSPAPSSTPK